MLCDRNRPSTTDDHLFDNLSPGDLYRYRRTSRDCKDAVDSYIRRHFRLHDTLRRYFDSDEEIIQFRRLQSTTGMFISGSTALQFFEQKTYPESDLDLYVEHRFRRIIAAWFVQVGYKYVPPAMFPDETLEEGLDAAPDIMLHAEGCFYATTPKGYIGAAIILNFEKEGRKIQLITKHYAVFQMVLNFHSTCVMNIITHEKAYSIFPRATFDERRSLLQLPMKHSRLQIATAKYSARGWTMIHQITEEDFHDPHSAFAHGQRLLGDGKCWTLPILPKLDLPKSSIEANSWSLLYDADMEPTMTCTAFVSPTLRYGYLVADEPLRKYVANISLDLDQAFEADENEGELDDFFTELIEEYRVFNQRQRVRDLETGEEDFELERNLDTFLRIFDS